MHQATLACHARLGRSIKRAAALHQCCVLLDYASATLYNAALGGPERPVCAALRRGVACSGRRNFPPANTIHSRPPTPMSAMPGNSTPKRCKARTQHIASNGGSRQPFGACAARKEPPCNHPFHNGLPAANDLSASLTHSAMNTSCWTPHASQGLNEVKKTKLVELFNKLDTNGDGELVRRVVAAASLPSDEAGRPAGTIRRATAPSHRLAAPAQDLEEFKGLGLAITGREPTDEEVRSQLSRADADGNESLDLAEWLAFGTVLAGMPDADFIAMIDGYIAKLGGVAASS